MNTVSDAVGVEIVNRIDHSRGGCVFPGMDRHLQACILGFKNRLHKITYWVELFAICQIDTENMFAMTNRPVHGFDTGLRTHTMAGDSDIANCNVKFFFCAGFGTQESVEAGIPSEIVSMKC